MLALLDHQISYTIRDGILGALKSVVDKYLKAKKKFDSIQTDEPIRSTRSTDVYDEVYAIDEEVVLEYPIAVRQTVFPSLMPKDYFPRSSFFKFERPVYGAEATEFTHFMAPGKYTIFLALVP